MSVTGTGSAPNFSAHVGEPIDPHDKQRLEDTAAYLVRNPLSLRKLVYLDRHQAVLYRSHMNPSLGRNFEALDPLEWLARMSDHIPDPGQHRTILYGHYANRVRDQEDPRPPRPQHAAARQAPARPRDPPRRRARRKLGRAGRVAVTPAACRLKRESVRPQGSDSRRAPPLRTMSARLHRRSPGFQGLAPLGRPPLPSRWPLPQPGRGTKTCRSRARPLPPNSVTVLRVGVQ